MNNFFRSFFATLLAMVVFAGLMLLIFIIFIAVVSSQKKTTVGENAVLLVDLATHFPEIEPSDAIAQITGGERSAPPSLYHLTRLIRHAKDDGAIKGIYIKTEYNSNDFASSEEIRNAILDFKKSGKFVYAYSYTIPQKAYYVGTVSDKMYCAPTGGLEWHGFSMTMPFIKGTLQ
jgi:protease-4